MWWEGEFARGAADLWGWSADGAVDVEEHQDLGCKAGYGMGKAVQAWRAQAQLVHLSENGNK